MSTRNPLTPQERQACILLSEIFLDTELTPWHIHGLASSLHPLAIPVSKLEQILRYDVFPTLYPNCLSVAGVWAGFDEEWLIGEVNARRSSGFRWISSAVNAVAWHSIGAVAVRPTWVKVKEALDDDKNGRT
jgi:hypothetical protein